MFLLSTDIDGTIYDGPETATAFAEFWEELRNTLPEKPILAYNTGRGLKDVQDLVSSTPLPEPDWMICGVGTTIYQPERDSVHHGWLDLLSHNWDYAVVEREIAENTPARPQPSHCQNAHKCSWFWENASAEEIDNLQPLLRRAGVEAQAIYSSNRDLDILPVGANKGNALTFLARELGVSHTRVIVSGDSGNDSSMFFVENVRGIIVSNAETALFEATRHLHPYRSESACAFGVIEGIQQLRRQEIT